MKTVPDDFGLGAAAAAIATAPMTARVLKSVSVETARSLASASDDASRAVRSPVTALSVSAALTEAASV